MTQLLDDDQIVKLAKSVARKFSPSLMYDREDLEMEAIRVAYDFLRSKEKQAVVRQARSPEAYLRVVIKSRLRKKLLSHKSVEPLSGTMDLPDENMQTPAELAAAGADLSYLLRYASPKGRKIIEAWLKTGNTALTAKMHPEFSQEQIRVQLHRFIARCRKAVKHG